MTTKRWKGKASSWRMAYSLEVLLREINDSAPGRSKASDGGIGDVSHQATRSEHNPCGCCDVVCARDFTHDPKGNFDSYDFAEWLRQRVLAGETRVKYVISNGKIYSGIGELYPAGVLRPYGGANRHSKHVHVSVKHPVEFFDDKTPWGWPS